MATEKLTDITIRNLKPKPKQQYEVWDSKVTGLGIRVSPKGAKSWVLLYRLGRQSRRLTLGRYPAVSLADARDGAQRALREVAHGKDPAFEKTRQRSNPHAFDGVVASFVETYAKPRNKSWAENSRVLERDFVGFWGKRDIRHIKKSDVTDRIDRILAIGGPSAANHGFAHIRKLFNWAVERGIIEISPCQGLKAPAKTSSRDRVLSENELTAVWCAAEEMGYPFGPFVQLLILTGQRREEVSSMRWDELDLEKATWSLPKTRTKANRAHVVPLTPQALAVLGALPSKGNELVFAARTGKNPISGFSKWKKKLQQQSNTSGWTLHDIRRTVATGMARSKVPPHVVERVLNHTNGTLGGVAGVYNRFGYLDEMKKALEAWGEQCEIYAKHK